MRMMIYRKIDEMRKWFLSIFSVNDMTSDIDKWGRDSDYCWTTIMNKKPAKLYITNQPTLRTNKHSF